MNQLNLRIRNIIFETLLREEEFRLQQEKELAKNALLAFTNNQAKVTKVEESSQEDLNAAMEQNHHASQGYAHFQESPLISFTFNHHDYTFNSTIDKEYVYKTEKDSREYPGYEEMKLKNVSITQPTVSVYNEEGAEYEFSLSELGAENVKNLNLILTKYIS